MNLIIFIILLLLVLCSVFAIICIVIYNKYQQSIIKINEAENNIDIYLQKKLDFLTKIVPSVKEEIKDATKDLEKLLLLKSKKLNNLELNGDLDKYYYLFKELIDLTPSLEGVESIHLIYLDLCDNEDDLNAAKDYYNFNVTTYNKLVKAFPSNLVGIFCHYKLKDFYIKEKTERFEILKK